ncbi:hypothetical protein Dda_9180 [Drechslerella dactyloides]|uniref:GTP-binding protein n=1 Tax=Drechslerella dactyloides TaxID=74499 RepID=A0AAD6NGU4_DREDA|nr:hypothetical protein Dda_9180 [Drechslerella dactyloides]
MARGNRPQKLNYSLERWMQDPSPPLQSPTPSKVSMQNGPLPRVRGAPRPRLLLQGQRRSGKSSISSVVFHKMPPTETLFLESTTRIQKEPVNTFMDFQVWDFPGQIDYNDGTFDLEAIFSDTGALIYVIDAQDEYLEALTRLHQTIITIQRFNPSINVEVFIHKVDGLSDDFKLDTQRDIVQRTTDELADLGFDSVHINYHLTSIYDHSIFEAFSKVIQKLLPELGTLENLLNGLVSNCRIEKAFLFDVLSKIYVATDSSPVDVQSYEICSDYIDVVLDMTEIYGYDRGDSSEVSTAEESKSSIGSTNAEDWTLPDQSSVMKLQNGMVLFLREINNGRFEHLGDATIGISRPNVYCTGEHWQRQHTGPTSPPYEVAFFSNQPLDGIRPGVIASSNKLSLDWSSRRLPSSTTHVLRRTGLVSPLDQQSPRLPSVSHPNKNRTFPRIGYSAFSYSSTMERMLACLLGVVLFLRIVIDWSYIVPQESHVSTQSSRSRILILCLLAGFTVIAAAISFRFFYLRRFAIRGRASAMDVPDRSTDRTPLLGPSEDSTHGVAGSSATHVDFLNPVPPRLQAHGRNDSTSPQDRGEPDFFRAQDIEAQQGQALPPTGDHLAEPSPQECLPSGIDAHGQPYSPGDGVGIGRRPIVTSVIDQVNRLFPETASPSSDTPEYASSLCLDEDDEEDKKEEDKKAEDQAGNR